MDTTPVRAGIEVGALSAIVVSWVNSYPLTITLIATTLSAVYYACNLYFLLSDRYKHK